MSAVLDLLIVVLFGAAALAIARLDGRRHESDQSIAWVLGGACTLAIIGSLMYEGDAFALVRAIGTSVALGLLPLSARMLYREGIDLIDAVMSGFAGFVLGVTSWSLAWRVMLTAAAIAGIVATVNLLRNNTTERIFFGYILAALAFFAATSTALGV